MGTLMIARLQALGIKELDPTVDSSLLAARAEPHWFVAQTQARHEKRVAAQLENRGIDHFLPLYERVSRWKDRRVRLQLPLFDGYVFVRLVQWERLRALEIPSVVRLVGFGGQPAALPDAEIESLREGIARKMLFEPHPYLTIGRRVRVSRGPLEGNEGILIRKKNHLRVVISINLIRRSVALEVDSSDIEALR
jgi:transcription antitermination factor NusG